MLFRIAFDLDGDPDLSFYSDADLDPASKNYAEAKLRHGLHEPETGSCLRLVNFCYLGGKKF
jgi:hypothetical protein